MLHILSTLLILTLPALVIVASLYDVTSFRIPNWISLAAIGLFFPAALLVGAPLSQIGVHLGVGVAALLVGMFMYAIRWVGGGDAKLFGVTALWVGWPSVGEYLLYTALFGGALAIVLLNLRSDYARSFWLKAPAWVERLRQKDGPIPYGVAIAGGALAAFPSSSLVQLLSTQS